MNEKGSDTNKDKPGENMSFNSNDLKGTTSTPKGKNYKDSELHLKDELLHCKECRYTCTKENSLKNHMITKHELHQCKQCQEKLTNLLLLHKHIAEHHTDNQSKIEYIQWEEMALANIVNQEEDQLEEFKAELSSL